MRINNDLKVFIARPDWYEIVEGVGYVPTDKAPVEAVDAMKRVNERANKGLEI